MSSSDVGVGRNPPWSRDERVIGLDLYMRHREQLPSPEHPDIIETSKLLNQLSGTLGSQFKNFRNANSVYMKLANFRGIDPIYTSQGKKGLQRGAKGDAETWNDFANEPERLRQVAVRS